jgi:hypothetical protein
MIAAMMYFVLEDCFDEELDCGDALDNGEGDFEEAAEAGAEELMGGDVVLSRIRQNEPWPLEPDWQE